MAVSERTVPASPRTPRPVPGTAQSDPPAGARALHHFDGAAFLGLAVALAGILLGLVFEGGALSQVLQPTAGLIVFGGTIGAVAVQFPPETIRRAAYTAAQLLRRSHADGVGQAAELLRMAVKMRRNGPVSLDPDLEGVKDLFTRRCLTLAVDGVSPREIEDVMTLEMERYEDDEEQAARVWEAAGGFAPTMGILGAVLGLIQVMQRLDSLPEVGRGIAVAFVATVYGVGSANLVFLPVAGRLRARAFARSRERSMVLDAVLQMAQGASPRALRERLGAQTGTAPVLDMTTRIMSR